MNKVILVGELTSEPQTREAGNSQVTNLRMVTKESIQKRDGEVFEKKDFHRIVVWGNNSAYAANLCQGDTVSVCGRLETSSWESNGEKKYMTQVNAREICVLSLSQSKSPNDEFGKDDIPF